MHMNSQRFFNRPALLLVVLSCCVIGLLSPAYANNTMLLEKRPAIQSDKASKTLLTSITRVGNKLVTVGDRGHILVSEDDGSSWVQADVPVQLLLTSVSFATESLGWAVGHEAVVLHTKDGGAHWDIQYANPYKRLTDEELSALTDEEFARLPQAGSPLLDVWFRDANRGFAVGAYGMFLCTNNGGQDWVDCASRIENVDGWHLNSITPIAKDTLLISGEKGVLFRSSDGGETWETLNGPYDGSYFGALQGHEPGSVYIFGLQGNLFHSPDLGDHWDKIPSKTSNSLMDGVVFSDQRISIVGNSGLILTSNDGGKTFKPKITDNRTAILSVVQTATGKVLMVGQAGVSQLSESTDFINIK